MKAEDAIGFLDCCAVCNWQGCTENRQNDCGPETFRDAVNLAVYALKLQIPVEPINRHADESGSREIAQCPVCQNHVFTGSNYCDRCGRPFKWGNGL